MNPYSSGVVQVSDFLKANFMIVVNCQRLQLKQGALQLLLKFGSSSEEKRVLLYVPVFQRKLVFDKHLDVTVE